MPDNSYDGDTALPLALSEIFTPTAGWSPKELRLSGLVEKVVQTVCIPLLPNAYVIKTSVAALVCRTFHQKARGAHTGEVEGGSCLERGDRCEDGRELRCMAAPGRERLHGHHL